jgi:hypothetical protein
MALAYNQALSTQPSFSDIIIDVTAPPKGLLDTLHMLDDDLEHQLGHSVKLSRSVRLSE